MRLGPTSWNYYLWCLESKIDASAVILNKNETGRVLLPICLLPYGSEPFWLMWRQQTVHAWQTWGGTISTSSLTLPVTTYSSLKCSGNHTSIAWSFASGTGISFWDKHCKRRQDSYSKSHWYLSFLSLNRPKGKRCLCYLFSIVCRLFIHKSEWGTIKGLK